METMSFYGPGRTYQISYDQFGDVLYVKSIESRAARRTIFDDDGFQWRLSPETERPAGFTVHDFNYVWQDKIRLLVERIKTGMDCDDQFAEGLTEAIVSVTAGQMKADHEIFDGLPADRPITPR